MAYIKYDWGYGIYTMVYNGSSPSVKWTENRVSDFYDEINNDDKKKLTRYDLLDFD